METETTWDCIFPVLLICLSSLFNSIYLTIIFAKGLELEKSTTILFWVFLLGVVILWPLSAVFEGITIPQSMEDKFLLIACGLSTTAQSYVYIAAARILNPSVLSITETIGIPIFFAIQVLFLQDAATPENLTLQIASIVVIFIVSVGLPSLELLLGRHTTAGN